MADGESPYRASGAEGVPGDDQPGDFLSESEVELFERIFSENLKKLRAWSLKSALDENAGHLVSLPPYLRNYKLLQKFTRTQLVIGARELRERLAAVESEIARRGKNEE